MFDFSWGEVMVIGGVALIVIGPKDLPKALRTVGQMTAKVRRMAGEFQSQFNEAMREAELDEVRKDLQGLNTSVASATTTAFNPIQTIRDEIKGAVESGPAKAADAGTPAPQPSVEPVSAAAAVAPAAPMPDLPPVPPVADAAAAVSAAVPTARAPASLPAAPSDGTPRPQS
jgi:sec-independent protein translocase protein TatB